MLLKHQPMHELTNIENITHEGYEFLKVPTLETVYKNIGIVSKEGSNENIQNIALSLESKIKTILSIGIFSGLDKINYANANFLHIDFDPIKDLDEYVPIFLSLFLKLYRMDKLTQLDLLDNGIERPYITYIFEEAKNVLSQESFEDFIAKFINEARSYRIKVGFTTQLISHVPAHIFTQVGNNAFLALLALVIVVTFLFNHPIYKKKKVPMDKETLLKIKNIKLFNISDIGYEYKAFSMVESMDGDREIAKMKLKEKALRLGADAVINVMTNIDNKSTTTIGSVPGMPRVVSGKTTHDTTYCYEGTAVKLL
jgi:uncharacterized protein YbjQ (UPF0145 family)